MGHHLRHDVRRAVLLLAAVVLVVAGVASLLTGLRGAGDPPPQPDVAAAAESSSSDEAPPPDGAPSLGSAPAPAPAPGIDTKTEAPAQAAPPAPDLGPILARSEPVALEIPSIGVRSDVLVPLEVGPDGALAAPADYDLPGWHRRGPAPGQLGPAVIAGHVDGPAGPAVFYRLGELAPGDLVRVTRQDGSVATFSIDSVERFPKQAFPTSRVYGNTTDRAEIRLITCGGFYDRSTGHYVDNVVAFGHLLA
jgi:Sortase domain